MTTHVRKGYCRTVQFCLCVWSSVKKPQGKAKYLSWIEFQEKNLKNEGSQLLFCSPWRPIWLHHQNSAVWISVMFIKYYFCAEFFWILKWKKKFCLQLFFFQLPLIIWIFSPFCSYLISRFCLLVTLTRVEKNKMWPNTIENCTSLF